jgi:hypothetical protein
MTELHPPRGIKVEDILRDNRISATLDIDPVYVNWICKAIRRDPRYIWREDELRRLGVLGLEWDTVSDDKIKELAIRLSKEGAHGNYG